MAHETTDDVEAEESANGNEKTALIGRVNRAREWLDDVAVLAVSADRTPIDGVGRELLIQLGEKDERLEEFVDVLRDGANALDWEDEERAETYLTELDESAATVDEILGEIGTDIPDPLSNDQAEELREAVGDLRDRADGLVEDL